mgnify:CR=1 FL=1
MYRLLLPLCFCLLSLPAWAGDDRGLITLRSENSVPVTLDRFEQAVRAKGMTVFARVDHAAGAQGVGLSLPPMQVLIFGNPKIGTLLMQSAPTAGIDLPLKVLAWEDSEGVVWLAYNDPAYLAGRHAITDRAETVAKMQKALGIFAGKAVSTE